MSTLLSAHAVDFGNAFGPLFHSLDFSLKKGDRIGLIGDNGSGKSTLLKILSGELAASHGSVTPASHCLLARIEQHLPETLFGASLLDGVIARLPAAQRSSERWRAEALLHTLGFSTAQQSQHAATLSGGQHMRLLLARALILQPDLLLLDEPGNHLDLPTLLWLENFLIGWQGSFVLVSHDSALLDRLMHDFGGRDNIVQVDACLTRLRVTVKSLAAVDAAGLQQAGAIGVVILGHEVHAIFGTRSDSLRQLLEARFFSPR